MNPPAALFVCWNAMSVQSLPLVAGGFCRQPVENDEAWRCSLITLFLLMSFEMRSAFLRIFEEVALPSAPDVDKPFAF